MAALMPIFAIEEHQIIGTLSCRALMEINKIAYRCKK
jgi:hypothetical protein